MRSITEEPPKGEQRDQSWENSPSLSGLRLGTGEVSVVLIVILDGYLKVTGKDVKGGAR